MVTTRTMEVAVPAGLGLFGAVIIFGSLSHETGWTESGPGAGYFPLRLGSLIVVLAAILIVKALAHRDNRGLFLSREAFHRVGALFLQTAICAGAMPLLGCYVPSALFLAYSMRRLGKYGIARALFTGVAVMAVFFVVFEFWFMVPLAKGPLEALFGFY